MIHQLRSLGILVRDGQRGDVKVKCPRCSDSRKHKSDPCLSVNITEGIWNCHNCGWSGSVKKKKEYTTPPPELKTLSEDVLKWFAGRGITSNTVIRYKISEGIDYMPQVGKEVRTIHFNYHHNGELVNIKYRDSNKNFKLHSGAQLIPYGIDVATDNSDDELVIVEGEMDALSFYEVGIKTAISVPNGASKGSQKLEWLEEFIDFFEGKKIYIATDMDEAGISLRNELARRIGKDRCWIIEFPYKDANDTLVHGGSDALVQCYNCASQLPVDGIDDANSVRGDILSLYDTGTPKGYDTGYEMDSEFLWHPGQVTLVTGIPGHGKSTWLKNIIYRLANRHGLRSFIYSAEEANAAFALTDLIQIATGKSFFESKYSSRITKEEVEEQIPFMNDHFKFYKLHDNDLTIEGILDKAKWMIKRFGINVMVIDNMSTVEKSMSSQTDTRHHQIKNMMNDISRFARNYDVHVFLVAHPKKMTELKNGIYKVPNGYDVGDSSHWFNLPDNGITVYRNLETSQTEIHRWKVRFKYSGQLGSSCFTFNINNSRYESAQKINDGKDKEMFVGQPYTKRFAGLADSF